MATPPPRSHVTIRVGMGDADTPCSLAHKLGHAHYNDPPGHFKAHAIRADRFAAKLLVSPVDYAAAEALYRPHPTLLAHELGVTVKVLKLGQPSTKDKQHEEAVLINISHRIIRSDP